MAKVEVSKAGSIGLNMDLSQHDLPIQAWTAASNIRFLGDSAWQFYGYGSVYGTPVVVPYHLLPVNYPGGVRYWIYAGLNKILGITNTAGVAVPTDLTRASGGDYAATPNSWTSTVLGGIPVLNNGVDDPQCWFLDTGTPFVKLTNWPASTKCKALRSFRNFLVAMGVTESGTYYPYLIRASTSADPGTVPTSWVAAAANDAVRFDLAQATAPIVDGCQLRDALIVYTEKEVFRLDYTGGAFIDQATKVLGTSGAMNKNCIVEIDGFQVCLTTSDVIVHDGQQARSCLDRKTRRWLFQNMDVDAAYLSFVFKHPFFNEVYIAFAKVGSTAPDTALVWNWVENTCSIRALPSIFHAAYGPVDNGLNANWNQDSAPWSTDLTSWNGGDLVPSTSRVMMGGQASVAAGPKLYLLDGSTDFDGTAPTAYLERRGLTFGMPEYRKIVTEVRPRIFGNRGNTVLVKVGVQEDVDSDPVYGPAQTYTIGTTKKLDFLVDAPVHSIRFESGTAYQWRLDSYDVILNVTGDNH